MKKHATTFLKLFTQRLSGIGLEKIDNNCCQIANDDCIAQISYFMFYNQKSMQFNSGGDVYLFSPKIDDFFKDYNGKDVFRFYYTDKQYLIFLVVAPMIWYLQLHHGKDKYPGNMYTYFDKATVINEPEVVVEYFYRELYQRVFLPICENYGTFAMADKSINDEILKTGEVKEANIVWADHDFHCMRSLLFGYMNNNPKLPQLVEICNAEMERTRKANPESERLEIYDFIVEKVMREL